jgi:hypothetical protein
MTDDDWRTEMDVLGVCKEQLSMVPAKVVRRLLSYLEQWNNARPAEDK